MTLDDYYDWACKDAERRGLPALKPVLDALRTGARQLRDADWNDDASGGSPGSSSSSSDSTTSPRAAS